MSGDKKFSIELPDGCWGVEVWLDLKSCNDNVKNADTIKQFAKDLVESIQMEQYGETQCVHFGKDDKKGYTLSGLLTTSNYCAHFSDETRDGYLNVFSCKNVDTDAVIECVYRWFAPEKVVCGVVVRGDKW